MKAANKTDIEEDLHKTKNLMYIPVTMLIEKQPLLSYGTAYVQVYKLTRVTRRASRNFACNSCVGLMQHEEYTARERLLIVENTRK